MVIKISLIECYVLMGYNVFDSIHGISFGFTLSSASALKTHQNQGLPIVDSLPFTRSHSDMNFRLLATDIDGTITDEKGRIHLKAMEVIRNLEALGIPVVLVSGRPLPFVESLAYFMGTSGPVIAENGAVVKLGGEVSQMGDPQAAKEALAFLKTKFPVEQDDDNRYRMVDVSIKMTLNPERIRREIGERQLPVDLLVTNVMFHLVDNRVSKGRTLLKVLDYLMIKPEETVVCGDSYNDLPLFEIGAFRHDSKAKELPKLKVVSSWSLFSSRGFLYK